MKDVKLSIQALEDKKLALQVAEIHNYLYATNNLLSPYGSETLRARIGQEVKEIIREELAKTWLRFFIKK